MCEMVSGLKEYIFETCCEIKANMEALAYNSAFAFRRIMAHPLLAPNYGIS